MPPGENRSPGRTNNTPDTLPLVPRDCSAHWATVASLVH